MTISKKLHYSTFFFGCILFFVSIISAVLFSYPHFYTWFALGSWLILDWIDYRKNKISILGYFYNHKHRITFFVFFFIATITAFIIDYLYGVRFSNMWQWPAYSSIHFIRMYSIMNISYIFGMYELFRVIKSYLKTFISEKHNFYFIFKKEIRVFFNVIGIILGIIFLIIPTLFWFSGWAEKIKYIMIFPFLGMWLVSDSITSLLKGKSIMGQILRGNILEITSLALTTFLATIFTETINLFAHEWIYVYMPFSNFQLLNIPIAVFIGWIPLVLGVISLLNMVKHVNYLFQK